MTDFLEYVGLPKDQSQLLLDVDISEVGFIKACEPYVSCAGISESRILVHDLSAKLGESYTPLYHMEPTKLGFPDEWYDFVCLRHVIEYQVDMQAIVREARRVLKRSGRLCIRLYNDTYVGDEPVYNKRDAGFWDSYLTIRGLAVDRRRDVGEITDLIARKI